MYQNKEKERKKGSTLGSYHVIAAVCLHLKFIFHIGFFGGDIGAPALNFCGLFMRM